MTRPMTMAGTEQIPCDDLMGLVERLYPICRSITGDGVRETLRVLQALIPLEVHEVPSGTQVLDWTIPDEWNIRDAWIKDLTGRRVVDFRESNLHVVSYSEPVRRRITNSELQSHLHSLPEHSDWIPYRTSYYSRTWGFCLSENQRCTLTDDEYDVCIDSQLAPGKFTYGELFLPGERQEQFIVSSHICHPSLCNDNLSGIVVSAFLARHLARKNRRWSYRFLYMPGTIGAITWLAQNRQRIPQIKGGLTLVCLGDSERLTYKRSFQGVTEVDRAAILALRDRGQPHEIIDYAPHGYDERQFNSPGFRIPVGSLMRGRHGEFAEYHTSADNLAFITEQQLMSSLECLLAIIETLEGNRRFLNQCPHGEPQLGKRGIYHPTDGTDPNLHSSLLWVLSLSDGDHTLYDISERSKLPFPSIERAAGVLVQRGILKELDL